MSHSIEYRPEIDGLRAVAVIPVLLFHLGFDWIQGGFVGVDVFFVISGFLITSIVLAELKAGTFSLRNFWARRVRRILPLVIVVATLTLAVASLFTFRGDHPDIGAQALASLFSIANLYFWRQPGGYWGSRAEESPFLHCWSLSVEEQFYLGLPIVALLVFRYRRKWFPNLLLFVMGISFAIFVYGTKYNPEAAFYLLPTSAWELAAGCYLAAVSTSEIRATPYAKLLAFVGLFMVVTSFFLISGLDASLVFAITGTVLILAFGQAGGVANLLSWRPLVHIGRLSYSLYLWHWPVFVLASELNYGENKWSLLGIVYLLSLGSYFWVEQPTRRRKGVIPFILSGYLATSVFGTVLALSSGTYDTSEFAQSTWQGPYYDLRPNYEPSADFRKLTAGVELPKREVGDDAYLNGGIIIGEADGPPRVVVLGDSHGVMWSGTIRAAVEELQLKTAFYCMNGVPCFMTVPPKKDQSEVFLTAKQKSDYDMARLEYIRRWKPDVVIICARWSFTAADDTTDLLNFLTEHASKVLLIEQPPELAIGDRNALQHASYLGLSSSRGRRQYFPRGNLEAHERGRSLLQELTATNDKLEAVHVCDIYLGPKTNRVLVIDGDNCVYLDDDHLLAHGATLALAHITEAIRQAIESEK